MTWTRRADLDDPARPWREVWSAGQQTAKLYVRPRPQAFGRLAWAITASLCSPDGRALSDELGACVMSDEGQEHLVQFAADSPISAAAITQALNEGRRLMLARVVAHAEARAVLAALSAPPSDLTVRPAEEPAP
jgi:hypothetical protein